MAAIYPNAIFGWTPRQDYTDIVWANDPNSIVTEVQAIETVVGTKPQIEMFPPVWNGPAGSGIPYPTLSVRVSAAMNGVNLPYTYMRNDPGFVIKAGQQVFNTYSVVQDPYNMWNGPIATVPCAGYWSISAKQRWSQQSNQYTGASFIFLYVGGPSHLDGVGMWSWTDALDNANTHYPANVLNGQGWTQIHWEGLLDKGDQLQVLSASASNCPSTQITEMTFHAMCHRTVNFNFVGPG